MPSMFFSEGHRNGSAGTARWAFMLESSFKFHVRVNTSTTLPLLCFWWTLQHIKHLSSLTRMLLLKKIDENIGCHLEGHWSVKPKWKLEPCPLKKTMQYNAIYHVHTGNSFQENQKKAEIFPKSVTTNIYRNGSVFFSFSLDML